MVGKQTNGQKRGAVAYRQTLKPERSMRKTGVDVWIEAAFCAGAAGAGSLPSDSESLLSRAGRMTTKSSRERSIEAVLQI